jgi:hypothetical protein
MSADKVKLDGSEFELSLSKVTGLKIKDVGFYVTEQRGEMFAVLTDILFDDGTRIGVGGAYDMAFLERPYYKHPIPALNDDALTDLYRET